MKTSIIISCITLLSTSLFAQSETTGWWYQLENENENAPKLSHQGMETTLKIINQQRFDWDNFILGWKLREVIENEKLPIYANTSVRTPFSKNEITQVLSKIEKDTLFLRGDTIIARNDSTKRFNAYREVRVFKTDLQAVCDSLFYNNSDSVLKLFQGPILWNEGSEMKGDSVFVFIKGGKVDEIKFINNSFTNNNL